MVYIVPPLQDLLPFAHQNMSFLYLLFSLEILLLILCQSRSVVCPSYKYVRPSVLFLVNVSPPKPLEVATSNFVVE